VTQTLNLGIVGAGGRMGRSLLENVAARDDLTIAAAIERPGSENLGKTLGPHAVSVTG
ncbi:unnamed protein product, partial [Laminaria digitata]